MQPLERLVNLVALLLEARTPLTFEQIREKLAEAYEHGDVNSAKRMFERDKDVLRDIGVPIEVTATDVWDAEQGYAISKDRYYVPEISFTPSEISALVVAARSGDDTTAEDAVRKLLAGADEGILASLGAAVGPVAGESTISLTAAAEAVASARRVAFGYRTASGDAAERSVDAYGLAVRGGHWYLVGFDHDRGEIRSFRLSRVASPIADAGEGSAPPEGFRATDHVVAGPWGVGEPARHAVVAFAPEVAWWAVDGIPGSELLEPRSDGWTVARIPWTPGESLASWVLSFGPEAEAVEPGELRHEVARRLEELGA